MKSNTTTDLLSQIEADALDATADITSALRKCISLGGRNGSASLRAWATQELKGYEKPKDAPSYRTVPATFALSAVTHTAIIDAQTISPYDLPDFAQELEETCTFTQPIAELQSLVRTANEQKTSVRMGLPMGTSLVKYMNSTNQQWGQQITQIFLQVSPTSVVGIIDNVRTTLVELVAEMRANTPTESNFPSKQAADRAVNVVINGEHHGDIQVIHDSNTGDVSRDDHTRTSTKTETAMTSGEKDSLSMKAIVAISGVVAAVAGIAAWGFDAHWWG